MTSHQSIVWFRQDLRLSDNPALSAAAQSGSVLPVYIFDDVHAGNWQNGEASDWWLHHSLKSLDKQLNNHLLILQGDPSEILPKLVEQYQCSHVYWNRCYEPWQIKRDTKIKLLLKNLSITVQSFNAYLLWEPNSIKKADGTPFKVFTPYYKNGCLKSTPPRFPINAPEKLDYLALQPSHQDIASSNGLDKLNLLPTLAWDSDFYTHWEPGEKTAKKTLSEFLSHDLIHYKTQRDIPATKGTSKLSPHLHFGEISINQVWYAARHLIPEHQTTPLIEDNLNCYLSELGWREFSYYLLYHFPSLPEQNFQPKFDRFPWQSNSDMLQKWQQGKTGYPIIDAGMRELWQTGYMHNRVRMIVASFLVKNLLINWREGEKWFRNCLLDSDLASNSASWQWVAGSGADAAPYFRIFNPITQSKKFDSQGSYIKRYCPELTALPAKYIHAPWDTPKQILAESNIKLGIHYPNPLIDITETRKRALEAFGICKNDVQ